MSRVETERAYAAEFVLRDQLTLTSAVVHGTTLTIPVERKFGRIEDIQRYVDMVLALNWVRDTYPSARLPLKVVRHRVINRANCGHGELRVNDSDEGRAWSFREVVILHEVAHHLTPCGTEHGVEWRACFLDLLDGIVGPEAAFLLRTNFHDQGLLVYTNA